MGKGSPNNRQKDVARMLRTLNACRGMQGVKSASLGRQNRKGR